MPPVVAIAILIRMIHVKGNALDVQYFNLL